METKHQKVIITIPTYNEKDNVPKLASAIFNLYPDFSVLVVDDNSPDGTSSVVRSHQAKFKNLFLLERKTNRGFGRSYIDGFKKIIADNQHDAIVTMDADFSHSPEAIAGMVSMLDKYPVVVGSRYVGGGVIENWQWHRKILSRFANLYVRLILGVPVNDMTTGFMCFRKSALDKIDLDAINSDGYSFLVEMKYRFSKVGLAICEYPITFSERREGESKMSGSVIWESIWMPWRLLLKK